MKKKSLRIFACLASLREKKIGEAKKGFLAKTSGKRQIKDPSFQPANLKHDQISIRQSNI
jgi:hypothetical protein